MCRIYHYSIIVMVLLATMLQEIHGQCEGAPKIICPPTYYVCPSGVYTPDAAGWALASPFVDGCDSVELSYIDTPLKELNKCGEGWIRRIWKAVYTITADLYAECNQFIKISDERVPEITKCLANQVIYTDANTCKAVAVWNIQDIEVSDNCGIDSVYSTAESGQEWAPGDYEITHTFFDGCKNQISCTWNLQVVERCCKSTVELNIPDDYNGCFNGDSVSNFGLATGYLDSLCGELSVSYIDDTISNTACNLSIDRTWIAQNKDKIDDTVRKIQRIRIIDTITPVINNLYKNLVFYTDPRTCTAAINWNLDSFDISDNCKIKSVDFNIEEKQYSPGVYIHSFTVSDQCGNTSKMEWSFDVIENCCKDSLSIIAPNDIIGCPGLIPAANLSDASVYFEEPCITNIEITTEDKVTGNACNQTIYRLWKIKDTDRPEVFAIDTQVIFLRDIDAPVIVKGMPDDTFYTDIKSCLAPLTWDLSNMKITDNCGIKSISSNIENGFLARPGIYNMFITITDSCGNEVTDEWTATVIENCCKDSISMVVPPMYMTCLNGDISPEVAGWPSIYHDPICIDSVRLSYSDNQSIDTIECGKKYTRLWILEDVDNPGNVIKAEQMILHKDIEAPVIIKGMPDMNVTLDPKSCNALVAWSLDSMKVIDNCGLETMTTSHSSGQYWEEGVSIVTVKVVDKCNNISIDSFVVTVSGKCCKDSISITAPNDYLACPNTSIETEHTGDPISSYHDSICIPKASIKYSDVIDTLGLCNINITRTWRISDDERPSVFAEDIQVITLKDDEAPKISDEEVILEFTTNKLSCKAIVEWKIDTFAYATDNCGIKNVVASMEPGVELSPGDYNVVYTYTDYCGNSSEFIIKIRVIENCCKDEFDLVIPNDTILCINQGYSPNLTGWADIIAEDDCPRPELSYCDHLIEKSDCKIIIRREWLCKSIIDTNNLIKKNQIITLIDDKAPVIVSCLPNITINSDSITCLATLIYDPKGVVATDECTDVTINFSILSGTLLEIGEHEVVVTATDKCGHETTCSFVVTVVKTCCTDTTKASFNLPKDKIGCLDLDISQDENGVAEITNLSEFTCAPIGNISYYDSIVDISNCHQVVYRVWNYTLHESTITIGIQTLTKIDTVLPSITGCPKNIEVTLGSIHEKFVTPEINVSSDDNCGISSDSTNYIAGIELEIGTYDYYVKVTDNCGNVSVCNWTIVVNPCVELATIECPSDITFATETEYEAYKEVASYTSNCGIKYEVKSTDDVQDIACTDKVITRTWRLKTGESIIDSCVQVLTISRDSGLAIEIGCPENIVQEYDNPVAEWTITGLTAEQIASGATMTISHTSGSSFAIGTTTVSVTTTNACGIQSSCTFDVTINPCVELASIECPSDITFATETEYEAYKEVASYTSNCGIKYEVKSTDDVQDIACTDKVITRTWRLKAGESIIDSCVQVLTISRDSGVAIEIECPENIVQEYNNPVAEWTIAGLTAEQIASGATMTISHTSGSSFAIGTTTVSVTTTNACGIQSSCTFDVTINPCVELASIECPSDITFATETEYEAYKEVASYTSNCGIKYEVISTDDVQDIACTDKVITRTWKLKAGESIIDSCVQVLTISRDSGLAIEIGCPENIVQEYDNPVAEWTIAGLTAEQIASGATMTISHTSGSSFAIGTTTVSVTTTNACGIQSSCTFDVTINPCVELASIECPSDITFATETEYEAYKEVASYTSNCGIKYEVKSTDDVQDIACTDKVITRTWRLKAGESIIDSCVQVLTISRDSGLAIEIECPENIVQEYDNPIAEWTIGGLTAEQIASGATMTISHTSGSSFAIGTTTVNVTTTNACGIQSSCTFDVTINPCVELATIECPSDITFATETEYEAYKEVASYTSNCGIKYEVISTDDVKDIACTDKVITRTWRLKAGESIIDSCVQVLTISRDSGLAIQIECPENIVQEYDNPVVEWTIGGLTAEQIASGATMTISHTSGSSFAIGTTTVSVTTTNACGIQSSCTFDVTINPCVELATIECPSDITFATETEYEAYKEVASYTSNCGIKYEVISTDDVQDIACTDKVITRTWRLKAGESNIDSCVQVLTISRDSGVAIEIECPENIVQEYDNPIAEWTIGGLTAEQIASGATMTISHTSGSSFAIGTTTVSVTTTNACGIQSSCTFDVTINPCVELASIECPSDITFATETEYEAYKEVASYTSNCGIKYEVISTDDVQDIACTDKVITRTWRLKAGESIIDSCVQVLTISRDSGVAIEVECPENITLGSDNPIAEWTLQLTDAQILSGATLDLTHESGDEFPLGTTTVIATATNACGISSSCSFDVTVNFVSKLTPNCPIADTIKCTEIFRPRIPEVENKCNICVEKVIPGFIFMGKFNGHKYYCSDSSENWETAKKNAEEIGGYLAVINTKEENDFVASKLMTNAGYIGLSDIKSEGVFTWVDGSAPVYTNWNNSQPNDYLSNQDNVEITQNGKWNDQSNDKKLEYIVEIPCYETIITNGQENIGKTVKQDFEVCYTIINECGDTASCCYPVHVDTASKLNCVLDFEVVKHPDSVEAYVAWPEPNLHTCCDCPKSSEYPKNINGFIYMGTFQGKFYYCSKYSADFVLAQKVAKSIGGNLAIIESAEENAFIASLLNETNGMIGLSDQYTEGKFEWINGTPITYTNWYENQPKIGDNTQNFVEMMGKSGYWNDIYNYVKREFVVEIDPCVKIRQIEGPENNSNLPKGTYTITYESEDACNNKQQCSFKVTVVGEDAPCSPTKTTTNNVWVNSVTIGSFNHFTGSNNGYHNYSGNCIDDFTEDSIISISVSPGFRTKSELVYWTIFADLNNNGTFENEEILMNEKGFGTIRYKFSESLIPQNVVNLKLRIIGRSGQFSDVACGNIGDGEVEDYCILVNHQTGALIETRKDNKKSLQSIVIAPNPTSDFIVLGGDKLEDVNIQIVDLGGKILKNLRNFTGSTLNLSDYNNGTYIVRIIDNQEVIVRKVTLLK